MTTARKAGTGGESSPGPGRADAGLPIVRKGAALPGLSQPSRALLVAAGISGACEQQEAAPEVARYALTKQKGPPPKERPPDKHHGLSVQTGIS